MRLLFSNVFLVALCISVVLSVPSSKETRAENGALEWWKQSVVYQVYPRSFKDSDGDGIGDINGIISKLDYFVDLGISAVWISPIYKSPMKDFGYDISNFTDIDPQFGTLDDFRNMAQEFKKRGLKLIMDIVPNHSSDEHEWFIKSVRSEEPYTDYYVWKDPKGYDEQGKPILPNNWVSLFGGPAWEWNDQRQQFYLHQFVKEQPDLNFENIDVRNEMLAMMKFWLDAGVDGFRVDAVPHLFEDPDLTDEPINPDRDPAARPDEWRYYSHVYTYNLPRVFEFLADVRQLMDVYSAFDGQDRCMMVEAGVPMENVMEYYGTQNKPIAHFPFNFRLNDVRIEHNASEVLSLINVWYDLMPPGEWANFQTGNHDQKRAPARWTNEGLDGANMVNLLLQGTAITYNGEELGMNNTYLTWEQTVDPAACNTDPERYEEFSRDPARTPFQWSDEVGAGFSSSSDTWLPLNPDYKTNNLKAQQEADESHYKVYKELVKLRNTDAWRYGSSNYASLNSDKVLAFSRVPASGSTDMGFLVLYNLSGDSVTVDSTALARIPASGTIRVRSVGFHNSAAVVGGSIDTRNVALGARDSIVIEFTPI